MNLIIVTSAYPKEGNLYKNAFVHSRVKNYINAGIDVKVFVSSRKIEEKYLFDGIEVLVGDINEFNKLLIDFPPDKILVHFLQRYMTKALTKLSLDIPIFVWVHGSEALGWYRRLFNFNDLNFIKYIGANTLQMSKLRKFVRKNPKVHWIFVSNWMKKIMETDTLTQVKNWSIIPNVVDDKVFSYCEKDLAHRNKILIIRPFKSRKYATDVVVNTLLELSKSNKFSDFEITIIGDGPSFEKTLKPLKDFQNITIQQKFLKQEEIKEQHDKHGIFLCPTRQDAQGVSMCEAMSSGLVPIASNNTAIPEYVKDGETGMLSINNPKIMAKNILYLENNPQIFLKLSKNASSVIQEKCKPDIVINRELDIIGNYGRESLKVK